MAPESFAARLASAIVTGGALLSLIPSASAASVSGGALRGATDLAPSGVEQVQYADGSCAELRRACLYKRELGERGQGNCSRYRAQCSGSAGYSSYSRYRSYRAYRPYYRAYRPWGYYD